MTASVERLLLDTSLVIELIRGKALGVAIAKRYGLDHDIPSPFISVVTLGELRSFSRQLGWGTEKRARLDALVRDLVVVDIGAPTIIDAFADISTLLRTQGRVVGDNDRWIAATAKVLGARLLTFDKDFSPLIPSEIAGDVLVASALLSES